MEILLNGDVIHLGDYGLLRLELEGSLNYFDQTTLVHIRTK